MSESQASAYVKSIKLATDLHALHFQGAVKGLATGNANKVIEEANRAHAAIMQIFRNAFELGKLVSDDDDLEEYARKLAVEMINE